MTWNLESVPFASHQIHIRGHVSYSFVSSTEPSRTVSTQETLYKIYGPIFINVQFCKKYSFRIRSYPPNSSRSIMSISRANTQAVWETPFLRPETRAFSYQPMESPQPRDSAVFLWLEKQAGQGNSFTAWDLR